MWWYMCTKGYNFQEWWRGFWALSTSLIILDTVHPWIGAWSLAIEKICPILNIKELKKNDYEKPLCYAAQTKNLESLFNSTSGSAFATLAEKMYKLGGYVGGAIFNDDYSVKQFISSNKADLEKLRNSKYVQSDYQVFIINTQERAKTCHLARQTTNKNFFTSFK